MEHFTVKEGTLQWTDEALLVDFDISITKDAQIEIVIQVASKSSARSLIHRLNHGSERRLKPFFKLAGSDSAGSSILSEYTYIQKFTDNLGKGCITITAATDELRICDPEWRVGLSTSDDIYLEYLARGLPGFSHEPVMTPAGELHTRATLNAIEASKKYGSFYIQPSDSMPLAVWLKESDDIIQTVLQIYSLTQGRTYLPTARNVRKSGRNVHRRIRPRKEPPQALAQLISHFETENIIRTALRLHGSEQYEDSGLRLAISWMMLGARSLESRILHLSTALETLTTHFERNLKPNHHPDEEADVFKDLISPAIKSTLKDLHEEKKIDRDTLLFFKGKIGNLHWKTFYDRVTGMLRAYGVPIKDLEADLRKVIGCRNKVVHEGNFPADLRSDKDELYRLSDTLEELLKRTALSIMQYEGRFMSCLYNLRTLTMLRDSQTGAITISDLPQQEVHLEK